MASVAVRLFKEYGIPHSWSAALVRGLLTNDYQSRTSCAQGLLGHLLYQPLRKDGQKISADALEVTNHYPYV